MRPLRRLIWIGTEMVSRPSLAGEKLGPGVQACGLLRIVLAEAHEPANSPATSTRRSGVMRSGGVCLMGCIGSLSISPTGIPRRIMRLELEVGNPGVAEDLALG